MPADPLIRSLLLAALAGLSIPVGAALSGHVRLHGFCREKEFDSFLSYFGAGALLAAVALILIPHGMEVCSPPLAAGSFLAGSLLFFLVERRLEASGAPVALFLAMLLDYVPESMALGAGSGTGSGAAALLAVLIALQNLPEAFSSRKEMAARPDIQPWVMWTAFGVTPLIGAAGAGIGHIFLADRQEVLGVLLFFCSGGILYLLFQQIVPEAHLKRETFPAIGSVLGFLLGLAGVMAVG